MQDELVQQWTELSQANLEVIKQFSENYTRAITDLTQRQLEMVCLYLEGNAKQLEVLSQAKSIPDLITAQSRLFAELNDKLMHNARLTLEVLVEINMQMTSLYVHSDHNNPSYAPTGPIRENYTRAITDLTQQQMEMISLYIAGSAKQLETLGQAKNVPDLINSQSRLFVDLNDKLMDNARRTLQELVKVMSEKRLEQIQIANQLLLKYLSEPEPLLPNKYQTSPPP